MFRQVTYILRDENISALQLGSETTLGQRVTGHESSGSTNLSGSRGSRASTRDPLIHDQVNQIPTSKNRLTNE